MSGRKKAIPHSATIQDATRDSRLCSSNSRATSLILYGIATDYCVRFTALDALEEGFAVTVAVGLSRGVTAEGIRAALQEIKERGATVVED